MELRHLRYFVAVAEELHFRRAAERLHISQPPLSQQVRALEAELGAELFVRSRRRVELTAAGEALLQDARGVLAAVDAAAERTRRVARGEVGELAVGFVGSAMYGMLPELLREFRDAYPDVDLRLRELSTGPQLDAVRAGRLDVGFLRPPVEEDHLEIETLVRERVVVALPAGHRFAGRTRLRLQDLGHEDFVLLARREAPGLHALVNGALDASGASPKVVQEVAEMQTAVGLVAAGVGISLVPASVGADARSGVAFVALAPTAPTVELALAWRRAGSSPALEAFLALARRRAAL